MVRETDAMTLRENAQGGTGTIEVHEILTKEQMLHACGLFAKILLPPGTSIGFHYHPRGEMEAYYILEGKGIFQEADGSRIVVRSGDICSIEAGAGHGLENTGGSALTMIALVCSNRKE